MAQERTYKGQIFDAIEQIKNLQNENKLIKEKLQLLEDLKEKQTQKIHEQSEEIKTLK